MPALQFIHSSMSAHDVFFVQSRPAHEFPEHALQENIGPGTYTMLAHQLHWCGCMIGSAAAIMNWRPTGQAALKTLRCRFFSEPSADPTD